MFEPVLRREALEQAGSTFKQTLVYLTVVLLLREPIKVGSG